MEAVKPRRRVVTTTTPRITSANHYANKLRPLDFGQLRRMVTIAQVLELIGWGPRSARGSKWRGPCPIHDEPNARCRTFAVEIDKNVYCCHSCGSKGNVLDLWVALRREPLLPAAWALIQSFGLEPPVLNEKEDRQDAKATRAALT